MSTKDLSKTIIEGGRANSNKYERRHSHAEQRGHEKEYLQNIKNDPESADDFSIKEKRKVYKQFSDKLSATYRWMDSKVGQKWDDVYSEIMVKFDTRTTAGRHVVHDHLLSNVTDTRSGRDRYGYIAANKESYSTRSPYYFVDVDGILRKNDKRSRTKYFWAPRTKEYEDLLRQVGNWISGRMIGEKGGKYYWLASNSDIWKAEWSDFEESTRYGTKSGSFKLKYFVWENSEYYQQDYQLSSLNILYYAKRTGDHWEWIDNPSSFKQRGELLPDELKTFKNFPENVKKEIIAFTKDRT